MPESEPSVEPARRWNTRRTVWTAVGAFVVLIVACGVWITVRALQAKADLEAALPLVTAAQSEIESHDSSGAVATSGELAARLDDARNKTSDPIWRAAELVPWIGPNLTAVRQVAQSGSDVADLAVLPLARLSGVLQVSAFTPVDGAVPLKPIEKAAPTLTQANDAVQSSLSVVRSINTSNTLGVITKAVTSLKSALTTAAAQTDAAGRAARLIPSMLGADGPRDYVLVMQNNAEARSTGGIVGALALVHARDGKITLVKQATAADFPEGAASAVKLPSETRALYGDLVAKYVQDVTLTPDFPISAEAVRAMWKQRFGGDVDGVISVDPVALSYVLAATGNVPVSGGDELTSDNAVQVLLNGTYLKYSDTTEQDAYFANAAVAVFRKVAGGGFDPQAMLSALGKASAERRILVWSAHADEQKVLKETTLSGALPTSMASTERFGVYLNDATGAKMDYYLRTKVEVASARCRADGRADYVVSVTLTSTAPSDAGTSLPWVVTGGGLFSDVPPGEMATDVAVYAPPGAVAVEASAGGSAVEAKRVKDHGHAVQQLLVTLTPGQSTTYEFRFVGATSSSASSAVPAAVVTPGVWPTAVESTALSCSEISR